MDQFKFVLAWSEVVDRAGPEVGCPPDVVCVAGELHLMRKKLALAAIKLRNKRKKILGLVELRISIHN
jgi:hypothetical protein